MMYKNNLAAVIKVNGRVLREQGDKVSIPFGSEYSILLKNMNSVRVQFQLQIDGQDKTGNTWIVIAPNSSVELERSLENGNWNEGNKFKFIERTKQIEQHRGIGAEDGLVRIEYKKEVVNTYTPFINTTPTSNPNYWPPTWPTVPTAPYDRRRRKGDWTKGRQATRGLSPSGSGRASGQTMHSQYTNSVSTQDSAFTDSVFVAGGACAAAPEEQPGEAGITVAGSHSNQQFVSTSWFPTELQSSVMVIHLRGEVAGKQVRKPVTVQSKAKCTSCGRTNKSSAQFCVSCGTSLVIYA